jgi:hypothetical protein
MRGAVLSFAMTSSLLTTACDAKLGPEEPQDQKILPALALSVKRMVTHKWKAGCNPDEVMISAYCSTSAMKPNGIDGARCQIAKADVVIACVKR